MGKFFRDLPRAATIAAGESPLVAGQLLLAAGVMLFRVAGKDADQILKAFAIVLADSERHNAQGPGR